MWAPDCVLKDGKYYFYFPAGLKPKEKEKRRGMGIGVGIGDTPYGPFKFEPTPIEGVFGIDPCVFIDKDGQAYMYWAGGGISVAKLKSNMREIESKPQMLTGLHDGFKEGPFTFERNGIYYLTYPNVIDSTESLVYSTANNPLGPFTYGGIIMDRWSNGCWTNHQSIVEYHGQWYLFYHHNDLSPKFDKARSIRADSLFFNADGSIQKVTPTLRGIGITDARSKIQIDRYSAISGNGVSLAFLDTGKTFNGWKIVLSEKNAWVKYNGVNFGTKRVKTVKMQASSTAGGTLAVHLDAVDGSVLAQLHIGKKAGWNLVSAPVAKIPAGVHNLVVVQNGGDNVDVDWITFE
jgi:hypothetical protein